MTLLNVTLQDVGSSFKHIIVGRAIHLARVSPSCHKSIVFSSSSSSSQSVFIAESLQAAE